MLRERFSIAVAISGERDVKTAYREVDYESWLVMNSNEALLETGGAGR